MDRDDTPETDRSALYLSAKEAANMLGVAVASLYAYVGRKNIRSQPVPGTRQRRYWREDVEQVARRGPARSASDPDTVLVTETKITLLTKKGQFYRGHSAVQLAEHATLEEVAALLWEHPVGDVFTSDTLIAPAGLAAARASLSGLTPREQAGGLMPLLERANPRSFDRSSLGFARAGGELMRWFAALTAGDEIPTGEPIHLVLARGWNAPEGFLDPIRQALVLFADYELTADTYAVRAVANTGCTPYQAVAAGILAMSGHRVEHGRANAVRRLIEEIMQADDPAKPIVLRCRLGEPVPGFGTAVIGGSARAALLFATLERCLHDDPDVRRLLMAISATRDSIGLEPNIVLAAIFIEWKLGLSVDQSTLKIAARMAGWIAHAYEQMSSKLLVRPRAAYTGHLPIFD